MSNTTRRDVLWRVTTAGVGATAVGLAGCSSSSEEGPTEPSANSGGATEEGSTGDGPVETETVGMRDTEQAAVDAYPAGGNLEAGETYEHTFETTGTHDYYCIPHEMNGMVGTIEGV